jgi:hypothetical protein
MDMKRCSSMLLVTLAWLSLFTSCGDITVVGPNNKTVGAACTASTDCAGTCLLDGHFPAGMCTITCTTDANCPSGSVCVDEEGGVCLASCRTDADCAAFAAGFVCHAEGGTTGSTPVSFCRAP